MNDRIMLGLWKYMLSIPASLINPEKQLMRQKMKFEAAMGFMTEDHRRVHHFTVRELPRVGKPMSPKFISQHLGLPREKVVSLLTDLEKHMTFLFRNPKGEVTWAYPVTIDQTPHQISPACQKCGSSMVKRTAQKGPKPGSQFWGCSKYPNCRGTLSLN